MSLKDRYRNQFDNRKKYSDIKNMLDIEIEFKIAEKYCDVKKRINSLNEANNRVWLLFGLKDGKEWECLQVAQSKNGLLTEIVEDVEYMFTYNYENLTSKIPENKRLFKNSTFYDEIYVINKDDAGNQNEKRKYSYSKMASEYAEFKICILNIDKYLGLTGFAVDNDNIMNMITIAKPMYAEAMVAYDLLARYWNMYNSGIDGQAIMIFLKEGRNSIKH